MKNAGDINLLMIGLSTDMVTQPLGDSVERHIEYARHISHLHIVVYAPREVSDEPVETSDHLTIYPSRSRSRYLYPLDAYRIGAQICRSQPINLVQTQDPFTTGLTGVWLKRRFGVPLQINNHASFFGNRYWQNERPLRHRVFDVVGRRAVKRADTLRVINIDQRDKYVRMGIEPERIEIIRPAVHIGRFLATSEPEQVAALRTKLGLAREAQVILWVGRPDAVAQKRLDNLLQAFALLRRKHAEVYLILVGDMQDAGYVSRQVEALGLEGSVICPGSVVHADLPAYYALCDVFALSSSYEGMGKVLLEAGASGKPVVATRIPGVVDVVRDGENGLLCEVENPRDMAEKIAALLSSPERAVEMGQRARDFAREHFDRERTIQDIVALWQRGATEDGEG